MPTTDDAAQPSPIRALGGSDPFSETMERLTTQTTAITRFAASDPFRETMERLTAGLAGSQIGTFGASLALAGSVGEFLPEAVLGRVVADTLVSVAMEHGAVDALRGQSFDVDAFIEAEQLTAEDQAHEGLEQRLLECVTELVTIFRSYIAAARSLPEVVGHARTLDLIIAALMLWYASQSATSSDIATLVAATHQASRMEGRRLEIEEERLEIERERSDRERERLELERRNSEALTSMSQAFDLVRTMAAERACELLPDDLYEVERALPVKAGKLMRSETFAVLQPGTVVRVIERAGKWVQIEYFDQLQGGAREGWVRKKYMCRIER